jgi:hypothetical protein
MGPGGAATSASQNSLLTKLTEQQAIDNTPAKAPGPNTTTNSKAQISELT